MAPQKRLKGAVAVARSDEENAAGNGAARSTHAAKAGVKRKLQGTIDLTLLTEADEEGDSEDDEEDDDDEDDEEEEEEPPIEVRCEVPVLFDKPRFLSMLAETQQSDARHWLTSDGRHLLLVELAMNPRELHSSATCALRGGSVLEHYFGSSAHQAMLLLTEALRPACRSYRNRDKT